MIKRRAKSKPNQVDESKLQLNGQAYFYLLFLQLLNLLTLITQLHIVYIVFAITALLIQVTTHLKIRNKLAKTIPTISPKTKQSRLAATIKTPPFNPRLYAAPKILPSWLILLCAIAGSISLALSGRELGLLMSMVHLLCFAYSLKTFEIPKRKDLYQIVMLGMFIATSSLIFIQSVYFSLVVIVLVCANLIVLMNFFAVSSTLKLQSKTLIKLIAYSIPLAIVLFIVFPKLSPFWQVPNVESAKVGLSDKVKIGDIAQLALSDELAFRVSFKDEIPPYSQQYWRAMVLDDFDGSTWQRGKKVNSASSRQRSRNNNHDQVNADIQGQGLHYQVITEPSFQSWLFALDFATTEQAGIGQRSDFSLYYRGIINQTLSYNVISYPEAILSKNLTLEERKASLITPLNSNPRLRAKGQQLRQQFSDNNQLIRHVLSEFNQQQYFYTLQPPLLNGDTLDQFYFNTKAGFCEHYASAFTYLMRTAGIPARMVVGYLGGEINPTGNYLTVYQRNAHAWAEVWLTGQGWVRVDPTSAVDAERVDRGFSSSLMQEYQNLSNGVFSLNVLKNMQLYKQLKQQLAALDYQWTRWVIGYTGKRQSQVMQSILSALPSLKNTFYFLITILLLVFTIIFIKSFLMKKNNQSVWQNQYLTLIAILAKQKLIKDKSMTAVQFAQKVGQQRPEISSNFIKLSDYYCQLQYQLQHQLPIENLSTNSVENKNLAKKNLANEEQAQVMREFTQCYRALRWQLLRANFFIK